MSLSVSVPKLEQAARQVVHEARRNGSLSTLTPRMVRQALESKFSIPEGTLSAEEYKIPLKDAIRTAATDDMESPDVEVPVPKTKKRKSEEMLESIPNKKQNATSQKPKKNSKKFKSSEIIPTSDIEDAEVQETGETSAELEKPPEGQRIRGKTKFPSPKSATPEAAVNSDSDLSVLDDEPPKKIKKQKTTKAKDKGGDKSKASKGSKASSSLSKDEETIKRLKSLVLACGVRRVWAKVFKDVDSPSQQIRILKETLADLGMSGRMSLEQAKVIKEKRELAQELEDVQAFAAATTRSKPGKPSQEEEEDDDEEEENEERPAKRKANARKSIMAFLEDQSDDD
ncbi:hypothetical protein B0H13DRAFT_478154 [Mycena leptocephala]|nr:hypothetical protein B0H13DRAFT_478154 [Mycena leptocephala]